MITQKGYARLLKHHGLDPDKNTDGDIDAKISNAMDDDEIADLENRAKEGDKAREALADQTLEKYANRIGKDEKAKAFYRDGLLSNREGTLAALEALPAPAGTQRGKDNKPLHNRAEAGTPEPVEKQSEAEEKKAKATAAQISNRARDIQDKGPKDNKGKPAITFNAAFNQAEREIKAEQEGK